MVPSKLQRHLRTKHGSLSDKHIEYFKRLLNSRNKQVSTFVKKVTVSDEAQNASYLIAKIVAQQSKPHTVAEKLIMPACIAIVKTTLGNDAADMVSKVPVSDNTVSRRIDSMSEDIDILINMVIDRPINMQIAHTIGFYSTYNSIAFKI